MLACPPPPLAAAFADASPDCASGKAATAAATAAPAIQTRFIMPPFPVVSPFEQGEPASWERTGGFGCLPAELTSLRSGGREPRMVHQIASKAQTISPAVRAIGRRDG